MNLMHLFKVDVFRGQKLYLPLVTGGRCRTSACPSPGLPDPGAEGSVVVTPTSGRREGNAGPDTADEVPDGLEWSGCTVSLYPGYGRGEMSTPSLCKPLFRFNVSVLLLDLP